MVICRLRSRASLTRARRLSLGGATEDGRVSQLEGTNGGAVWSSTYISHSEYLGRAIEVVVENQLVIV
jgi:hypothetical protein